MDFLSSSGPPEIISCIFRSCGDFPQILALASTCKHLHSIWVHNSASIITDTHIASLNVLSFEDALMAVRATNVVRTAYLSEVQPPHPFPFNELGSKFKSPTVEELKYVLDLRHLVRCAEYMFLHGTKYGHFSQMGASWITENFDESEMLQFRDRFHRATYRVFLAGAVLYRAFNEPFDLARRKQEDEAFLSFSTGEYNFDEDDMLKIRYPISTKDIEYLRKFAVYNFDAEDDSDVGRWRDEIYNQLFGPLSKYLVNDGEPRGLQKAREFEESGFVYEEGEYIESDFGPGLQGSIEEIMLLIGAYEQFVPQIANANGARSQRRRQHPSAEFGGERTRTITVVIFGIFALEEICMPTVVETSGNSILIARPYNSQPQKETQERDLLETSGEAHPACNTKAVLRL